MLNVRCFPPLPLQQRLKNRLPILLHLERSHSLHLFQRLDVARGHLRDQLQRAVVADAVWRELLLARELRAPCAETLEAAHGVFVQPFVALNRLDTTTCGARPAA